MTDHEFRPPSTAGPAPRVGAGSISDELPYADEPMPEPADDPGPSFWDAEDTSAEADEAIAPHTRGRGLEHSLRSAIEWVAVAIGALAVALLIKAFLLQAFYIPSESMADTLQVDDRVLVNKLSYRLGEVDRGDIVVFEKPDNAPGDIDDFIKRVVALPGETVTFFDGDVFIDGQLLNEPYVEGATSPPIGSILSEGCTNTPAPDRCTLAPNYYFVLGDNRNNSTDSRSFGPIHEDTIVGRAFLKVWPLGDIGFL